MILNYCGLIRYTGLYMFSIESYIKQYKKLDKIGKNRTVITLIVKPSEMINLLM